MFLRCNVTLDRPRIPLGYWCDSSGFSMSISSRTFFMTQCLLVLTTNWQWQRSDLKKSKTYVQNQKEKQKTCLCLSKSVRQIILCSAWYCTAKDVNQPQFQRLEPETVETAQAGEPWWHTKIVYLCPCRRQRGYFLDLFITKAPKRGEFIIVLNILVVLQHWFLLQRRVLGSNTLHSVIWYATATCLHPLFETVLWNNCIQLQSWIWTLKSLSADSWHSVPWPYPPHLEDWSSCKSLQAKGTVKVEGIVVIVVKAQWSLPSPWHCSSRPWSFATAVCCWAVGVPVRSLGALRGF